ncbi:hypothetical protein OEZ85_005123 [Tetradesmus obliquus]|uniref:AB hydrolase-1 domain-containing protein n=1 Tax=Tetradesmus obliquus TaxID=3088 RepID=A0ABY8UHD1_TETOB|nr:hypothetical protein OEZ85_005123 [Tetradesmus obliquus]
MRYPLFSLAGYIRLVEFIEAQFNYTRGTDLFALPYDFRLDIDSMAASGQLRLMAGEVLKRVARSGQKAIIIAHSHGATVGLQLLQEPSLQGKVQGYIALAPMFGGSVATLAARASGLFDYVLPWLTEELNAVLGGPENVRQHMYSITQGMPSVVQMMPYVEAFGAQAVAVTIAAGNKKYKVSDLNNFLRDIGETTLASSYSQVHAAPSLLKAGPPPGVQSFCIYGASSDTPLSLKYDRLLAGQPNDMPRVDAVGKGDGVVNLESLRLCKSIASSPAHVTELSGVTHFSVYSKRTALKAIRKALAGMLAPKG